MTTQALSAADFCQSELMAVLGNKQERAEWDIGQDEEDGRVDWHNCTYDTSDAFHHYHPIAVYFVTIRTEKYGRQVSVTFVSLADKSTPT